MKRSVYTTRLDIGIPSFGENLLPTGSSVMSIACNIIPFNLSELINGMHYSEKECFSALNTNQVKPDTTIDFPTLSNLSSKVHTLLEEGKVDLLRNFLLFKTTSHRLWSFTNNK